MIGLSVMIYPNRHIAGIVGVALFWCVFSPVSTSQNTYSDVAEWADEQKAKLSKLQYAELTERVRTTLDGGATPRYYMIEAVRTVTRFESERVIVAFEANGREIDQERAAQFMARQRRTFRPELVRMMESFGFPGVDNFQWDQIIEATEIERDGQIFLRVTGRMELPERLGPPDGWRPGGPPGGSQDGRPPSRGDGNPAQGYERPPRADEFGPPRGLPERFFTAWFTVTDFRLHATRIEMPLPGRFSLVISTTYTSIDGIDAPSNRIIEGTIPIRRRNRAYSVQFKQVLNYSDYVFHLN